MGSLRTLASQTAIYGISSILARLLNFLLVPLHTSGVFSKAEFGTVSLLYAYAGLMNILYTHGMETAYFRNAGRNPQVYGQAWSSILLVSTFFSGALILLAPQLAAILEIPGQETLIYLLAVILWIDAQLAIPFARLRHENKPLKFVAARVSGIAVNVFLQLVILLVGYRVFTGNWSFAGDAFFRSLYRPETGIGYVFWANLIGNISMGVLLFLFITPPAFQWNRPLLGKLWRYAIPIMLAGLLGIIPDQMDKIALENLLPFNFYKDYTPREALGVYSATFKLSVFMMLAIQAFRFAQEPFFFAHADKSGDPALYARVMRFFVIAGCIILCGVAINKELLGFLFLREQGFRQALSILPLLLLAKLFYGIYLNLSIWYKVQDKTHFGTYFALAGVAIFGLCCFTLIPAMGFWGVAAAIFLCYFTMSVLCFRWGQRHFFIPYALKNSVLHILVAILFILGAHFISTSNVWIEYALKMGVFLLYLGLITAVEYPRLRGITKQNT